MLSLWGARPPSRSDRDALAGNSWECIGTGLGRRDAEPCDRDGRAPQSTEAQSGVLRTRFNMGESN